MTMRTTIVGLAAAALLSGCADEAPPKPKAAAVNQLSPGEYELSVTVDSIRSTDQSQPASKLAAGAPASVSRTCVATDGAIAPTAFVEASEACVASDSYMSRGRISLQFKCTRPGNGQLTHTVDGKFTADSFTARLITATYFSGAGDYDLRRSVAAKRVGDCPPAKA
jgi:hypothetical protein